MDRLSQLLTLDLLPQLGVYRLSKKLHGLSAFELFNKERGELSQLGFSSAQIQLLLTPPQAKIDRVIEWQAGDPLRQIISYYDPNYPALLKQVSSAPMLLFCDGNSLLLDEPQIAIVGSRAATFSGQDNAKHIAQQLVTSGYTITSGLATGIDSYAHVGALESGGQTIAVLGSGLNNIYPKSNRSLARTIIERGGLITSEFWPDVAPLAANFPRRNRIVSGLSLGVIVVEAELKSGSLITARLAAEQNREVFAVPGSINNPKTGGCHKLIHQGAKLITELADILEELPPLPKVEVALKHKISDTDSLLSDEQSSVLQAIEFETTSIDQIASRTSLPITAVMEGLLMLELNGLISSVPGGYVQTKGGV